jgi:hypothetical protein
MSIAVPVAILLLLSAQVYNGWPNYRFEQKDRTEQADDGSSEKDKSAKLDKSSSAPKDRRHTQIRRLE